MRKFYLFLILMFLPVTLAFAVKMPSLYQAELPVASQADEVRTKAIKEGFLQVLIKISGDPQIASRPAIKAVLSKADNYVQEFSYNENSDTAMPYLLQISYGKNDINQLLKKAEVSYWGENRPLILMWVTVPDVIKGADMISNENGGQLAITLMSESKKYGLPLIFPVLDIADISRISVQDITNVSLPILKEVSQRYKPDVLLIGKIDQTNDGVQSKWTLILDNNQWNFNFTNKTAEALIPELMNQVSQTLAKHYVVKTVNTPQLTLKLEITNINEPEDVAHLTQYLKQLAQVERVDLTQVSGDVIELSLVVRGSLETFQQNASVGKRLLFKLQDPDSDKLIYEWVH